ncbi:hypothetical protein [Nocardia sp. IFM 10818]
MTTTVTVGDREFALALEGDMLVVALVAEGVSARRGSIFIGRLEPIPDPVYIEPDPVAPQPDPS